LYVALAWAMRCAAFSVSVADMGIRTITKVTGMAQARALMDCLPNSECRSTGSGDYRITSQWHAPEDVRAVARSFGIKVEVRRVGREKWT
jgi:hypothetical protein